MQSIATQTKDNAVSAHCVSDRIHPMKTVKHVFSQRMIMLRIVFITSTKLLYQKDDDSTRIHSLETQLSISSILLNFLQNLAQIWLGLNIRPDSTISDQRQENVAVRLPQVLPVRNRQMKKAPWKNSGWPSTKKFTTMSRERREVIK